jgi:hypothetical protein
MIVTSTLPTTAGQEQWRKQSISNELIRNLRTIAGERLPGAARRPGGVGNAMQDVDIRNFS